MSAKSQVTCECGRQHTLGGTTAHRNSPRHKAYTALVQRLGGPPTVFIMDTETTGLPRESVRFQTPDGDSQVDAFVDGARCRLVAVSRVIVLLSDPTVIVSPMKTWIVSPTGFVIPGDSIAIHGITNDHAMSTGMPVSQVMDDIAAEFSEYRVGETSSFNVGFDANVLLAEATHAGHEGVRAIMRMITNKNAASFCTLENCKSGRFFRGLNKACLKFLSRQGTRGDGLHVCAQDAQDAHDLYVQRRYLK